MTELVERARAAVLAFFGASPDEYVAIFTPNATGALRLVGEAYPFRAGDRFLLTFDNHNSVNGIREFARARGAETTYVPERRRPTCASTRSCCRATSSEVGGRATTTCSPIRRSRTSRACSTRSSGSSWRTSTAGTCSLDAAAFVPTNRLDLAGGIRTSSRSRSTRCSASRPASAACSRAATRSRRLERPWFSGGTIVAAFVQREWYQSAPGAAHFEDGTVNFLNLPAVEIGLRFLERVGIDADPRARRGARRVGCSAP